jgi:GNAT superfamily N-acetyltransferase
VCEGVSILEILTTAHLTVCTPRSLTFGNQGQLVVGNDLQHWTNGCLHVCGEFSKHHQNLVNLNECDDIHSPMMSEVHLRKATENDVPSILAITAEVVSLMNNEGNFQWNSEYPLKGDFLQDIKDDVLWVATIVNANGEFEVLGYAALTKDQPQEYEDCGLNISEIAIVPHRVAVSHRSHNQGIAKAFLVKAEEVARESDLNRIRIDTNMINLRMQRVCEKLEYILKGEISFKHKPEIYGKMKFKVYEKILSK